MKNLFAIEEKRGNEAFDRDGKPFVTATVPKDADQEANRETDALINEMIDSASVRIKVKEVFKRPSILTSLISSIAALLVTALVEAIPAPLKLILVVAPFMVLLVSLASFFREKEKEVSQMSDTLLETYGQVAKQRAEKLRAVMQIPEDAIPVDILAYTYKMTSAGMEIESDGNYVASTEETDVYLKDGMLCFFDYTHIYSIPTNEITSLVYTKETVNVELWSDASTRTDLAAFGVVCAELKDEKDVYTFPGYVTMTVKSPLHGDFKAFIAPYDAEALSKLIGLSIQEE